MFFLSFFVSFFLCFFLSFFLSFFFLSFEKWAKHIITVHAALKMKTVLRREFFPDSVVNSGNELIVRSVGDEVMGFLWKFERQ
jgi:hypothetical protein